jgi:putative flippase GtrA
MVKEQEMEAGDFPQEVVRYAEAGPVGDFIALASSVTAGILCFTNFFNGWAGYQTAYGVLMLVASAGIAAFSAYLLAARFTFRVVPALRSPSWAYFMGGFCMVVLTILALVFGWQGATPSPVLFFTFMNGVLMFIAGMVSS